MNINLVLNRKHSVHDIVLIDTAIRTINPKNGYNMEVFKKLPHTNFSGQEIDFGYYIKYIHNKVNEITSNGVFTPNDGMLEIKYRELTRKVKIKGDYIYTTYGTKINNDETSIGFMKDIIEAIIDIAKEVYSYMDNVNFQAGKRIDGSSILYNDIDWNIDEKEFFIHYLSTVYK